MRTNLKMMALTCVALASVFVSCGEADGLRCEKKDGTISILDGSEVVGILSAPAVEGFSLKQKAERIDPSTFRITCEYKALRDLDSALLRVSLDRPAECSFWMIPSVSYDGNNWGKGKEPKGASENGQWRTVSFRRESIPGAMYSEAGGRAVATWAGNPAGEKENYSISLQPDGNLTRHLYVWPEEEYPSTYRDTDRYAPGFRNIQPLRKGESVTFQVYVNVAPVLEGHRSMRFFLDKAWDLAPKPEVGIFPSARLWDLGVRYAKESLWAEEGPFRGFSIGLVLEDGEWRQRGVWKYEIGWCGQNASYAISLLHDYLKNGDKESLDKGIATLDTWAKCALPNGLFVTHYDHILNHGEGAIDACNLGTAAVNFFEACDAAKECGLERPEYERVAFGICDFVMADQQENGCYAKGWRNNGECVYREGTIGCFMVPAMIEAYRRSGNEAYLNSAQKAYSHYLDELKVNGFTTAGALDTWCIDKESSISLLRSAMRFRDLTGDPVYIEDALDISYYLSTWLWTYDGVYPEGDNFTEYDYHTFGATSVSTQHHHLDPYALYWVPEWIALAELTGDNRWKERALAIWRNGNQLVSDGTLEINGHIRPAGSRNEAFFECRWGGFNQRINDWLVAWPGAFCLETIRRLEGSDALD